MDQTTQKKWRDAIGEVPYTPYLAPGLAVGMEDLLAQFIDWSTAGLPDETSKDQGKYPGAIDDEYGPFILWYVDVLETDDGLIEVDDSEGWCFDSAAAVVAAARDLNRADYLRANGRPMTGTLCAKRDEAHPRGWRIMTAAEDYGPVATPYWQEDFWCDRYVPAPPDPIDRDQYARPAYVEKLLNRPRQSLTTAANRGDIDSIKMACGTLMLHIESARQWAAQEHTTKRGRKPKRK